jgi:hypothetical protein
VEVLANEVKAFGCEVSPKPFFSKECGPGEPTDSIYQEIPRQYSQVTDSRHEPEIDLFMIRYDSGDDEGKILRDWKTQGTRHEHTEYYEVCGQSVRA